jgi:hypothetical protein
MKIYFGGIFHHNEIVKRYGFEIFENIPLLHTYVIIEADIK